MRRPTEDKYTFKVSTSPVSGYKCYSVFRNGELYFTIDGERVSVFEDEVIESFTLTEFPQFRYIGLGGWCLLGCCR